MANKDETDWEINLNGKIIKDATCYLEGKNLSVFIIKKHCNTNAEVGELSQYSITSAIKHPGKIAFVIKHKKQMKLCDGWILQTNILSKEFGKDVELTIQVNRNSGFVDIDEDKIKKWLNSK